MPDFVQLVLQQCQVSVTVLFRSSDTNSVAEVREKFKKRIDNLAGPEGLLGDFFQQRRPSARRLKSASPEPVRRLEMTAQRRVNFVCHTGCQQSQWS